jgi:ornithine decarboxylase
MKLYHPGCRLLLRLKVDDRASLCKFSEKFGVDFDEVAGLLTYAKTMKLRVDGICFHVGSGCQNPAQYYSALEMAKAVFKLARDIGYEFNIIDIGGGFPGLQDKQSTRLLNDIAIEVRRGLLDFFAPEYDIPHLEYDRSSDGLPTLELIAEPGRFFVQSSHTLLVNIIGKKVKYAPDTQENLYYYYLNDGIYGSFNCLVFDHAKAEVLPYNERDGARYKSVIFGPTCDSVDKISANVELPELEIGEWCFVKNFGAYTVAAASDFNGFTKLKAFYVLC